MTFAGKVDGVTRYSYTKGSSSGTWQGWVSTTSGYKNFYFSFYGGCIATRTGTWSSLYFEAGKAYQFRLRYSNGSFYIDRYVYVAQSTTNDSSATEIGSHTDVDFEALDLQSTDGVENISITPFESIEENEEQFQDTIEDAEFDSRSSINDSQIESNDSYHGGESVFIGNIDEGVLESLESMKVKSSSRIDLDRRSNQDQVR